MAVVTFVMGFIEAVTFWPRWMPAVAMGQAPVIMTVFNGSPVIRSVPRPLKLYCASMVGLPGVNSTMTWMLPSVVASHLSHVSIMDHPGDVASMLIFAEFTVTFWV